jgi:hypothetical protein
MIHSIDDEVFVNKRLFRSRHSKSKHRKSHHYRSGEHFNATKLKSKHRTSRNFHQSSLDTNILLYNEIPFDTRAMVRDHLYLSIIGLLCFFPTGIFGLIRSMQAYEMNRPSSVVYWPKLAAIYGRHALRWSILSILIGTILWTIFIIYRLLREQNSLW